MSSGPVTMALGPFLFRSIGFGHTGLSRALETPWSEVQTAGKYHAQQWTGPSTDSVTITGVLFPSAYGGLTTLRGLQIAAKNGIPLMLVSLRGQVFGRHAVQRISEDQSLHDRYGTPRRDAYSIELKRLGAVLNIAGISI
ncbi:phage tail protein [Tropicimonas sp. IMCC34043]|uniref:phage tail protein n=1 Tax=Tropicimonas sp. IMCC34043 TaxID=2248760 RepID=UPI000E22A513|nr:phage tail protein [Tropicimonas sp. IMCC34043]